MRCTYCGNVQPVPDLAERRAALAARERAAREAEQRKREAEERAQKAVRDKEERRERRRFRRGHFITTMFALLIAPAIISVTVFDLPARLGYGSSGADRLEQVQAQLVASGCSVLVPLDSEYADGNVSQLVHVEGKCIRVLAAGGKGHHTLALKLFSTDGKEVAEARDTTDPQAKYCAKASELVRYEIVVSPASKGRLSHLVMACPAK